MLTDTQLQARMRRMGFERIILFNWETSAKQYCGVIDQVLAS
jgi:hypothetical protein